MELETILQAITLTARGVETLPGGPLMNLVLACCSFVAMVKVYRCALRAP